ncbi:hypothetical protein LTR36_008706 [Oleoguttula mirabilis]|uniref:Uncharacterized protein n=1 Tax=Oleoguttula mirabilis TaxID=1507867 RepID=A0AAV9JTT5_9PEZI|nr:hypothetical protein LTR36_008706 [Oleoguttula mirabilis]
MSPKTQQTDHFSKLSAELRLEIYGHVLYVDSPLRPLKTGPSFTTPVRGNPLTAHPYRNLEIRIDEHMRTCNIRRLINILRKASTCAADTKLKSVTVQLKDNHPVLTQGPHRQLRPNIDSGSLIEALKAANMGLRYTGIACLDILPQLEASSDDPQQTPRLRIEYPDAIKAWVYF